MQKKIAKEINFELYDEERRYLQMGNVPFGERFRYAIAMLLGQDVLLYKKPKEDDEAFR